MQNETSIEFESSDVAECIELWRSTAGSRPASVLHVENGAGVVAMFPPVASWDDLGPARDFDLVYPARSAATAALKLPAPWRALALSDFLVHIFDASRSASPEDTIRTTIEAIAALGGGLPQRLRAKAFVPGEVRA
jgi:hypothetical protein